jgi:chemotaxis protein methyltransferase CheR
MSFPPEIGAPGLLAAKDPIPQLLRDLIHERTGIYFEPDRFDMMLEKLEPRALAHRCRSYLDYFHILKYDEKGDEEWRRVMDAFSVQETYFWRETDQVHALVGELVPRWFKNHTTPLRIWSAACATGEEPYTLAIALREGGWGGHPIEILASDASETALTKARAGIYRERSFRSLPPSLKAKYFDAHGEEFLLKPEIRARVTFRWANLMNIEELPESAGSAVIFCRNVFIYFSRASIKRVADSFADRLPAGGHLFVGASESLLKLTDRFDLEEIRGAFAYVRNRTA